MAALAGLLGPEPAAMALNNASTVGFLQKLTKGEAHTKSLRGANGNVRTAIHKLAASRGEHSFYACKVKAHVSKEQERQGYITTGRLREHNGLADKAAREAVFATPRPTAPVH